MSSYGGCMYGGSAYEEGAPVPVEEPCLNCACTRGSLVCHLRVCPTMPDPPPRGCLIVHKAQKCCPQLICDHGCMINGTLYGEGSATDTSGLCRYCYCIRGSQHCVQPKCLLNAPGCRPVYNKLTCCPTKYDCSGASQLGISGGGGETNGEKGEKDPSPGEVKLVATNKGCSIDGKHYLEGDKVEGVANSSCINCYCIGGKITCEQVICTPPVKHNCKPVYATGHCCPVSYDCNSAKRNNTEETVSTTAKPELSHTGDSNLEYYANISSVNINKNTLDSDDNGVENRISTDEIELNTAIVKTTNEENGKPTKNVAGNTNVKAPNTDANVKKVDVKNLEVKIATPAITLKTAAVANKPLNIGISNHSSIKGGSNNMNVIRKTTEKLQNVSSSHASSTNFVNKTNSVTVNKNGGNNKVLVNNTKTHEHNNMKTSNKTSTVSNKIKTTSNSTKTNQINKVGNKITSQTVVHGTNKTTSTASNMNANKVKTNVTVNDLGKNNIKNNIPQRTNQPTAKPNTGQLLKNKPILQGNVLKGNNSTSNSTKQYVKVATKTNLPSKTGNSTKTPPIVKTNYEQISSSNNQFKSQNSSHRTNLTSSSLLNQTIIENNVGNDSLKGGVNQDTAIPEKILEENGTTPEKQVQESGAVTQNQTNKSNDTTESELKHQGSKLINNQNENSTLEIESDGTQQTSTVTSGIPPLSDSFTENSTLSDITSTDKPQLDFVDVANKNETIELSVDTHDDHANETILERTRVGSIDSTEDGNSTSGNGTAISTVRANIANKSIDLDYDYDSLPPSLPNLRIIPFVAADAVVDESNIFKLREDTESIIAITEHPYLDPFSNVFSPPVRTEGGFRPKEPILDGPYFESKIETTPVPPPRSPMVPTDSDLGTFIDPGFSSTNGPDVNVPLISFTEYSTDKVVESDYHCLFNSKLYKHGELVSLIDDCKVCVCFYGDIACQEPKCPEVSAGCRRVDAYGGCCGKIECDSNDIISTQIKDRFDQDTHFNSSTTHNDHSIEYIHLSEHQANPPDKHTNNEYDPLGNGNKNDASEYSTTTEEPSIEYISNNKYVIVKPTQQKTKYQTTTYKSILDDLLGLWETEDDNELNKGKVKNETNVSEKATGVGENIGAGNKMKNGALGDGYDHINGEDLKKGNTTFITPNGNLGTTSKVPIDSNIDKGANQNQKKPSVESEEGLFSSFFNSFSSMYSNLDTSKQKKPSSNKPANKNNIRIKPIVPHNPVKTKPTYEHQQSHTNLGAFSTSTMTTTTLFIPILRYNSTATKYYSVLETTPVNDKKVNHVHRYEEIVDEMPVRDTPEMYNIRVTQPPQIQNDGYTIRNIMRIPSITPETFHVTPKQDSIGTSYSYFPPSEYPSTTEQIMTNRFTTTTNKLSDSAGHNSKTNELSKETFGSTGMRYQNKIRSTTEVVKTTVAYINLANKNPVNDQIYKDKLETSTKTELNIVNKTTAKITQTTTEPDLFGLLGNLFASDESPLNTSLTKQETTTKPPFKKPSTPTKQKPTTTTTVKPETADDYDNFSLDSVLSYWFNSDAETTTTKKPVSQKLESRIDTHVDDGDDDDDDELYEDDEETEDTSEKKNNVKYIPVNGESLSVKENVKGHKEHHEDIENQYYKNDNIEADKESQPSVKNATHLLSKNITDSKYGTNFENVESRFDTSLNKIQESDASKVELKSGTPESSSQIEIKEQTNASNPNSSNKYSMKGQKEAESSEVEKKILSKGNINISNEALQKTETNTKKNYSSIERKTTTPSSNQKPTDQDNNSKLKVTTSESENKVEDLSLESTIETRSTTAHYENKSTIGTYYHNSDLNAGQIHPFKSKSPQHKQDQTTENKIPQYQTTEYLNIGMTNDGFIPIETLTKPGGQINNRYNPQSNGDGTKSVDDSDEIKSAGADSDNHSTQPSADNDKSQDNTKESFPKNEQVTLTDSTKLQNKDRQPLEHFQNIYDNGDTFKPL
ncbi:hypothetical protein WDU94_002854 [Cyamophila willieti]